jgi:hypothetical protein
MPLETEIQFKPVLDAVEARRVAAETAAIFEKQLKDLGKPMSYGWILKQVEGQQKQSAGGGGGLGSAAAAGIVGAGTFALIQAIIALTKQSKIVSTIQETIGKALGLLMDVVLMPFLPILSLGIVWLFRGVMLFHHLWSEIWNSKVIHMMKDGLITLAGLLAIPMKFLWDLTLGGALTALDDTLKFLVWLWANNFNLPSILLGVTANKANAAKGDDLLSFLYNLWFSGGVLFYELVERPAVSPNMSTPGVEAGVDENWFKPSKKTREGWTTTTTADFESRMAGNVNIGGITVNLPMLDKIVEVVKASIYVELAARGLISD